MKKLIFIVALMSLLMIFGGCAEANKPADPGNGDDSNKRFSEAGCSCPDVLHFISLKDYAITYLSKLS